MEILASYVPSTVQIIVVIANVRCYYTVMRGQVWVGQLRRMCCVQYKDILMVNCIKNQLKVLQTVISVCVCVRAGAHVCLRVI